jgi:hypothetical protein
MLKKIALSPVAVAVGLLAALSVTNPSKQAYAKHLVWRFQTTVCQQKQRPISTQISCSAMLLLPPEAAADVIADYSQRRNFIFFSLYSTSFLGFQNYSIGAGHLFWSPVNSDLSDIALDATNPVLK